jgi:hypothetical protein
MIAAIALAVLVLIALLWVVQRRRARSGGVIATRGTTPRGSRR